MWSCVVSLLPRVFFQHSNESEAPEGVLTRHARNSGQQRGIDAVGLGSGVVDGESVHVPSGNGCCAAHNVGFREDVVG